MRRLLVLALVCLAAGGCKTLEVKSATFNLNLNVTVPQPAPR